MCLAIPMKIISIQDKQADVEIDDVKRQVDVSLVDAKVGDYVIVHAGFAISILDEDEAKKTLALWQQLNDDAAS
jgi:hydrogenase expression/formation protein HypC